MDRNKYSGLWTFFNKNKETKVGVCKICNKRLSYKTTINNLKQHLKVIHREIYNNFFPLSSSLENVSVITNSEGENSASDNDSDTTKILLTSSSDIWDVFEAIQDTKTALCFVCNKVISYKSTIANLKQHLKIKHIEVYNLIINKSSSPYNASGNDNNSEDEDQKVEYIETFNNSNSRPQSPSQNVSIENSYEEENLQQDASSKSPKGSNKRTSEMWNFFEGDHRTKIARCNICQKSLSFKSTTANLKQHLNSKHSKAYNILVSKEISSSEKLLEADKSDGENSEQIKEIEEYNRLSPKSSPSSLQNPSVEVGFLEESLPHDNDINSSKRSRKLRSNIWQYFKGNHITQVAKCNICQKRISYKSTSSNLKQHLRLKHHKAYNALISNRSFSPNISMKQSSEEENSVNDDFNLSKARSLRSDLWNYFARNRSTHVAQCNLCQKMISFKSTTSNLKQHLRLKHYKAYNKLRSTRSSQNISTGDGSDDRNSPDDNDLNTSNARNSLKSDLWNYFEKKHSTQMAKCNLCKKLISFKSTTSNLTQHLRIKHHGTYIDLNLKSLPRVSENISVEYTSDDDNSLGKMNQLEAYNDTISIRSVSPVQNVSVAENCNVESWQQDCKNDIWVFFQMNSLTKQVKCNICQKNVLYKNTTANLRLHLKAKHNKIYSDLFSRSTSPSQNFHAIYISAGEEDQMQDSFYNIDDNSDVVDIKSSNRIKRKSSSQKDPFDDGEYAFLEPSKKIQKVSSVNLHKKIRPEEKELIDRFLLKLITDDFHPFSIVEDSGFEGFVSALNPNYQLPSRKILSSLLNKEYSKSLAKYQEIVRNCFNISLSLDCWTSRNMQSYMAVTGHFVDQNTFNFCSVLMECTALHGQHTAERIASQLSRTANTWGIINKINLIVSDNAANMVSAARILNWPHFGCYARKFNLIVQGALNDISITSIVTKVQKTVAYFKSSCEAKQMLREYQVSSQRVEQPKGLLLSVPTRWISVYVMLKRFSELQKALLATLPNIEEDIPNITVEEWQCIDEIVEVLKPFEEATAIMGAEGYIIASKAVVLTSGLYTVCTELAERKFNEPVANLVLKLKNGLTTNFGDIEKNKEVSICTLLDPRFKQHAFEDEAAISDAKQRILEKFQEINKYNNNSINETNDSTKPNQSTDKSSALWERFDTKVASLYQPEVTEHKTIDELKMYLSENAIPRSECPLRWWKDRKIIYPVLSKIFIACFNTVVTSLPCDKAFSKTGYIISDRRTRLTTSKVDKIMFLHVNK